MVLLRCFWLVNGSFIWWYIVLGGKGMVSIVGV